MFCGGRLVVPLSEHNESRLFFEWRPQGKSPMSEKIQTLVEDFIDDYTELSEMELPVTAQIAEEKCEKKVGRPTSKIPGVIYKKIWYDFPEDLIEEAKMCQLINKFKTSSALAEAAMREYIQNHK